MSGSAGKGTSAGKRTETVVKTRDYAQDVHSPWSMFLSIPLITKGINLICKSGQIFMGTPFIASDNSH